MKFEKMLPLLRCPYDGTSIKFVDETTLRSESGRTYPLVNGKPVLVRTIETYHVNPPAENIISKNTSSFAPPDFVPADGLVLNLGCGDVPSYDDRVISSDILPTMAADIVAEAEYLPITTGVVDFLSSGAVFEHVYDPKQAASEVRRVLKDGGKFYIDTAFMQGYHGYPSHFFNMTTQAIETFVVDDFSLDWSAVPDGATCAHLFLEVQKRMLDQMPASEAEALLSMPFRDVVKIFSQNESRTNKYLSDFSEYAHRMLAASFVVVATKPSGYDSWDQQERHQSSHLRRNYYAARMGVIQRYGEVELFLRRNADQAKNTENLEALHDILQRCAPSDTRSSESYVKSTAMLESEIESLTKRRDSYLS